MKSWFSRNYKAIIISAFLIPIITVALVSISHVTKWYGISNPFTWAIYLSIGIEIAALSALAAISADMGRKVYFPFGIVTLVQFIGNIYFAYSYININDESFKAWVELVAPFVEVMGVDPTDFVGHKRFLAFFAGGMLPLISLSFLHMLVKFTQENKERGIIEESKKEEPKEEVPTVDAKDVVAEVSRFRPTEEDLKMYEQLLQRLTPKETQEFENTPTVTPTIEATEEALEKIREQYEEREDYGVEFNDSTISPQPPIEVYENDFMSDERDELDGYDGFVTEDIIQTVTPTFIPTSTPTPEEVVEVVPENIPTMVEPEKPYGFEYTEELDVALKGIVTPEPTPTPVVDEEPIVEEISEPLEEEGLTIVFETTPEPEIIPIIEEEEVAFETTPEPEITEVIEEEVVPETTPEPTPEPTPEETQLPPTDSEEEKKKF